MMAATTLCSWNDELLPLSRRVFVFRKCLLGPQTSLVCGLVYKAACIAFSCKKLHRYETKTLLKPDIVSELRRNASGKQRSKL